MSKFGVQGKIKTVQGNFIAPIHSGLRLIVNFAGLNGKYDHPTDQAIGKIWRAATSDYRSWFVSQQKFKLGEMKETVVASDIFIVNLLVRDAEGKLNMEGLEVAVKKLAVFAKYEKGSLHFDESLLQEAPTFQALLEEHILSAGVNVYVYTKPELEPAKP
jgi:hypothetical protein